VHGYLTAVCFALLLPLSVVLARGFKEFNPAWFHVHRVIGTVAWIGGAHGGSKTRIAPVMFHVQLCPSSRCWFNVSLAW